MLHYLIPPISLMALITISSSIPMGGNTDNLTFITNLNPNVQNFLHIPVFGLLAYLWLKFFKDKRFSKKSCIFGTLIITNLFSVFDEFHQTFVPGRYGSLMDICLNIIGIITGIITGILFFFIVSQQRNPL